MSVGVISHTDIRWIELMWTRRDDSGSPIVTHTKRHHLADIDCVILFVRFVKQVNFWTANGAIGKLPKSAVV